MLFTLALAAALATAAAKPGILPGGTRPFEPLVIDQDSNPCPQDQSHHLLPHESDCAKFYYCEYGVKWEIARDCAPGTHFSYDLQVCVHPSIAGCTVEDADTDTGSNGETPETDDDIENNPDSDNESGIENPDNNDGNSDENNTNNDDENNSENDDSDSEWLENPDNNAGNSNENDTNNDDENNSENDDPDNEWLDNGCPANWHIHWLLPHESDCSKFYQCNFGELVERDCAPGTHFNPDIQVCDHPENVNCSASGSNDESNENNSNEDSDQGNDNANNDDEDDSQNNDSDSEWLDNGCPSNWHIHWLLPHESDCSKFYQCNFGEPVERDCAPGTHFNPNIQVCDHPENVNCSASGSYDGSNENNSNDDSDQDNNTGNGDNDSGVENPDNNDGNGNENDANNDDEDDSQNNDSVSEWLDNGCPSNWHIHWLLPHESDCSKFYQCNFGELVERDCAPGTHFNPDIQVCDHPENVNCSASGSNDESNENNSNDDSDQDNDTDNGDNDSGVENPDNNDGNGNENDANNDDEDDSQNNDSDGEWLDNGCPSNWHIHWLLPHESDCSKFYQCNFGELVEKDCAPGTHFNPSIQVCDHPQNVNCSNNEADDNNDNEVDSENDANDDESDNNDDTSDVDGDNDNDDNTGNDNTDTDGGSENDDNNSVDDGNNDDTNTDDSNADDGGDNNENENEWLENGCPADWSVHWLLPHETDCDKFYYCLFGQLVERNCAHGTHFNPVLQVCDHAANVNCSASEDNSTSDSNTGNNRCKRCEPGFWAHRSDCDKFWRCVDGKPTLSVCSEGLYFNADTQTCDFACNVECVKKNKITTTVRNDGLQLFVPWDKVDDQLAATYQRAKK